MNYADHITRDPNVCGGEPVIRGTRIPLRTILASLAEGDSADAILKDFPTLTADDVRAVIAFAAPSAEEDLPVSAVPGLPLPPRMKLKLDENLPATLVDTLRALGHDVDTVRGEKIAGKDDNTVWKAAQESGRI